MTVRVFGNSLSPAVANYAVPKRAQQEDEDLDMDAKQFVQRDFFGDDLKSLPKEGEAIRVLTCAQNKLGASNF